MLRISRGPCRAPGRLVVPPSHGTPISAMSSFFGSRSIGSRMNVAISPKRGTAMPDSGSGNLSAIASSGLGFEPAHAVSQARMLAVHGPDLFQHPAVRIVESLDERGQYMHVVAQASDLAGQPPQHLADIFEVDSRLARAIAQDPTSIKGTCLII